MKKTIKLILCLLLALGISFSKKAPIRNNFANVYADTGITITTQPSNVSVAAGGKAVFTVAATGDSLTYLWQFSTDGTTWKNTSQKSTSMSFTAAAAYSGRYYRCVITDANGVSLTTNAAKLTVGTATAAVITSQPSNVTVAPGEKAVFTVAATGDSLTYLWQYSKNGTTWTNTSQKSTTLSFTAALAHTGRYYRCQITDGSGNVVTSDAALLTVQESNPLTITAQPADVTVAPGEKAVFTVAATGDSLTYLWQFSTDGTTWKNTSQKSTSMSFTAALAHTGRYYRCQITDGSGNVVTSDAALLTVEEIEPLTITTQPTDITAETGKMISFTCEATGSSVTYLWQFSTNGTTWKNTSQKNSTMSFTTALAYSGRMYRCVVTDSTGNSLISDAGKLTVYTPSTFDVFAPKTITKGESVTVELVVNPDGTLACYQGSLTYNSELLQLQSTGFTGTAVFYSTVTSHCNNIDEITIASVSKDALAVNSDHQTYFTATFVALEDATLTATDICYNSSVVGDAVGIGLELTSYSSQTVLK